MSEYDDAAIERWRNELQPQIVGCDCCQPFDGDMCCLEGDQQSLAEFMDDQEIPEDAQELVAEELCCPCGRSLELDTEICVEPEESQADNMAADRFGDWAAEDNERVGKFVDHLRVHPGEGRRHEVGRELFEQLSECGTTTVSGIWYRAQCIDAGVAPSLERMGPPPEAKSSGRFNPLGMRAFYLGSSKTAAVAEARKYLKPNRRIWVQKFQLLKTEKVLALEAPTSRPSAFYQFEVPLIVAGLQWCDGLVQQGEVGDQSHYLLSQFVAESLNELGLAGITVNSKLHNDKNLVLFVWTDATADPIGAPEEITE